MPTAPDLPVQKRDYPDWFFNLPGKTILMHNRCGIRIELNLHAKGRLELWTSPLAGQSLDIEDRNFSNRDDHTRIFDAIELPDLDSETFQWCDYDPFHSVAHFSSGQKLHIMTLFDEPVVMLWFEQPAVVDIKTDKQDTVARHDERWLVADHPDRGRAFRFAAGLDAGGAFTWQPGLPASHRSFYVRVHLQAGQRLAIAGDLAESAVEAAAEQALAAPTERHLAENERQIDACLQHGRFTVNGEPDLMRVLEKARRVLLAMQDKSGAIRAAINRIYYLIWVRDGAIIEAMQAMAGYGDPLRLWTEFLMANPVRVEGEEPAGTAFVMLPHVISKWEEDGLFYATWTAFTAWTQTGDDTFRRPQIIDTLLAAVDWFERRTARDGHDLLGRFYHCESPLPGSRDDGWDAAVGFGIPLKSTRRDGQPIRQNFDLYINLIAYTVYRMLEAMIDDERAAALAEKADGLAQQLSPYLDVQGLPGDGYILLEDGRRVDQQPYGLDRCDYQWGLTLLPFYPDHSRLPEIRESLFKDTMDRPQRNFLAGWFSILSSLDPLFHDEEQIRQAIRYVARQCYKPGKFLPMPDTVVEMTDIEDGDIYHDVRPQAFSVGPWLATMTGLGLRRLPFGLAVRSTTLLRDISKYQYRGKLLNLRFSGQGEHPTPFVNGKAVIASLQLPEATLECDTCDIEVRMSSDPPGRARLVWSSVRLLACSEGSWSIEAFGPNTLAFADAPSLTVEKDGRTIDIQQHEREGLTWLSFAGKGRFTISG